MKNREIKFRAWDDKLKKMYYPIDLFNEPGVFYEDDENGVLHINKVINSFGFRQELIKTQFTGLKDKNNKEIYEGDIVKDLDKEYGIIEYINGGFIVIIKNQIIIPFWCVFESNNTVQPRQLNSSTFEVIGNIFETPDLCK